MSKPCGLTLFAIKAAYIVESTDYMTEMTFLANASTIYFHLMDQTHTL